MSEPYNWLKSYKTEEYYEAQITEAVWEHVCDHFEVEDPITDLDEDQIAELENFRNHQLSEYSILQVGYSNLISSWEGEREW